MVTADEFLARLDRSGGPDACWTYTGARDRDGYGTIRVDGRTEVASRVAYQLLVGPIPEGHGVLHHCDNPPCCNPGERHLFTGTQTVNMLDMVAKGREGYRATGDDHWTRKHPDRVIRGDAHPRRRNPGPQWGVGARGERNGSAKLTTDQVVALRRRVAAGETQRAVARDLGVSPMTVSLAVRGVTWR